MKRPIFVAIQRTCTKTEEREVKGQRQSSAKEADLNASMIAG